FRAAIRHLEPLQPHIVRRHQHEPDGSQFRPRDRRSDRSALYSDGTEDQFLTSVPVRLLAALAAYAILALLATFTLDGKLRIFIWILMGGLAIKTWIAYHTNGTP